MSAFCIFTLLVFGIGCGSNKTKSPNYTGPGAASVPGSVPIKGIVTLDGVPTANIRVTLEPKAELEAALAKGNFGSGANGVTDEKGQFEITFRRKGDGVVPGEYSVFFQWTPPGSAAVFEEMSSRGPQLSPELAAQLPGNLLDFYEKYKAGGPGMLTLKVEEGKPQTDVKFDLTTK